MPLDATRLAEAIKTRMVANSAPFAAMLPAEQDAVRDAFFKSVAEAVVSEITTNADVAFTAGQITGADSNGDTHSGLAAVGGSVT